jgi:hypothetical protein
MAPQWRLGRQLPARLALYSPANCLSLVLISVTGGVKPQGLVRSEGLGKLIKFIYFIRSRTRNLPTCSTVPQPTSYHAPCLPLLKFIAISDNPSLRSKSFGIYSLRLCFASKWLVLRTCEATKYEWLDAVSTAEVIYSLMNMNVNGETNIM